MLALAVMKILITIALFFSLASPVFASETLQKADLVGSWKIFERQHDIRHKLAKFVAGASDHKMRLTISEEYGVVFERDLGEGKTEKIGATNFTVVDDIYIFELPRSCCGASYKLVLGGWRSKSTSLLFGHFYLYNEEGLFNGWPVTFERENAS